MADPQPSSLRQEMDGLGSCDTEMTDAPQPSGFQTPIATPPSRQLRERSPIGQQVGVLTSPATPGCHTVKEEVLTSQRISTRWSKAFSPLNKRPPKVRHTRNVLRESLVPMFARVKRMSTGSCMFWGIKLMLVCWTMSCFLTTFQAFALPQGETLKHLQDGGIISGIQLSNDRFLGGPLWTLWWSQQPDERQEGMVYEVVHDSDGRTNTSAPHSPACSVATCVGGEGCRRLRSSYSSSPAEVDENRQIHPHVYLAPILASYHLHLPTHGVTPVQPCPRPLQYNSTLAGTMAGEMPHHPPQDFVVVGPNYFRHRTLPRSNQHRHSHLYTLARATFVWVQDLQPYQFYPKWTIKKCQQSETATTPRTTTQHFSDYAIFQTAPTTYQVLTEDQGRQLLKRTKTTLEGVSHPTIAQVQQESAYQYDWLFGVHKNSSGNDCCPTDGMSQGPRAQQGKRGGCGGPRVGREPTPDDVSHPRLAQVIAELTCQHDQLLGDRMLHSAPAHSLGNDGCPADGRPQGPRARPGKRGGCGGPRAGIVATQNADGHGGKGSACLAEQVTRLSCDEDLLLCVTARESGPRAGQKRQDKGEGSPAETRRTEISRAPKLPALVTCIASMEHTEPQLAETPSLRDSKLKTGDAKRGNYEHPITPERMERGSPCKTAEEAVGIPSSCDTWRIAWIPWTKNSGSIGERDVHQLQLSTRPIHSH